MPSSWFTWFIAGGLVLSLLLNVVALLRIGELRSEIHRVEFTVGNTSFLEGEVHRLQQRLEQVEHAQQWVTDWNWSIAAGGNPQYCEGTIPLVLDVTLQEIETSGVLTLEVRETGQSEWTSVESDSPGELEHRFELELDTNRQWEYRLLSEAPTSMRQSSTEALEELPAMLDRNVILAVGEALGSEDRRWARFVLEHQASMLSECNNIPRAELVVDAGDGEPARVGFQETYPGTGWPEGYDPSEQAIPDDENVAFDEASPYPAGELYTLWTDWVEISTSSDIHAVIVFADGSSVTIKPRPDGVFH